jgi:hypothetical protein
MTLFTGGTMTDIPNSDVYVFIKWVSAMPVDVYHLARPLLHGVCRLHEVDNANEYVKANPDTRYEFTRILAGHNDGSLEGLRDEATRELVTDFYAAHPRWVSVEERLPEVNEAAWSKPYLVAYRVEGSDKPSPMMTVSHYHSAPDHQNNNFQWTYGSNPDLEEYGYEVTHWRPLPLLPEANP